MKYSEIYNGLIIDLTPLAEEPSFSSFPEDDSDSKELEYENNHLAA